MSSLIYDSLLVVGVGITFLRLTAKMSSILFNFLKIYARVYVTYQILASLFGDRKKSRARSLGAGAGVLFLWSFTRKQQRREEKSFNLIIFILFLKSKFYSFEEFFSLYTKTVHLRLR